MRHLRLLALLAPALLLPTACENSSSSPSAPFTFEAGPGFEAGPSPEAGPLEDAGTDAPVVVPPPAGVTVTVVQDLTPQAGVRVLSQDATGAVIGDQQTDATGKLTIATAPSMVTVLATRAGTPTPVTYFSVAAGDNLLVRVAPLLVSEQAPTAHYSVVFVAPAAGTISTTDVLVNGRCGNSGDPANALVVDLYPNCIQAANAILALGFDLNGGRAGFAFKKGVAPPAANATDSALLGAWAAPGQTALTASNRPSGALSLSSALLMIANGAAFVAPSAGGSLDDGGAKFSTATGFSDAYQSMVSADDDVANANVRTQFIRREAVTLAPADFDFSTALPFVTDAKLDATSPARPTITVTSGSLGAVDAGAVSFSWSTAMNTLATWTFVLPASAAATFKAPALPADALPFVPTASATVDNVVFFEATQLPGYKEAKALPVMPTSTFALLDSTLPLPANGTVRVTSWAPVPLQR
jgi:hypothetical protein